ncbi:hypothetical protein W97_07389 [Coniosporium apollinis CBS 100218]|uniref:WSC domain-containing protein n=1 Tax=Coniosporium apollinis (strain CBS 100218) TaxID=1168221 RepID=R7Z156_CONA1|nr:uncharacterized protein W97_07389 [Coniosporium apollinis CBS 100218]EON67892.1 hypothetical protein W97_07389 [Coniosporium apollinis CBS 100218]
MSTSPPTTSLSRLAAVLLLLVNLILSVSAQSATATASSTPAGPTISPGEGKYQYVGCYNETTHIEAGGSVRALQGKPEANDEMTPARCFAFCGGTQFAGLEYGRECWCAPHLSSLSEKLEDGECDIGCAGENGTICGGRLRLTLYNQTGTGNGAAGMRGSASSLLAGAAGLGIVIAWFL